MTARLRYLLAAVGLWMMHPLPDLVAAEPGRLDLEPARLQPLILGAPSDQLVASAIAQRLQQSGRLQHYRIEVAVQSGVAELSGRVATASQREEAQRLAQGTPGVAGVVNRLTVAGVADITPVQAEAQPAPKEPAQVLPRPSTASPAGPIVEPMPMMSAQPSSPYDLMPPKMPPYAWPTYAPYNNYSRVAYPLAYPYNAFPFIGPPYPFPKVPLGWRKVQLEWQDGHWWFSKLATPYDWWRIRYW